jgi:drug/metabolite transporter (DMT)-like permease
MAVRIVALTSLAMLAFAANSVLARLALAPAGADALAYTGIRLASGAIALAVLLIASDRGRSRSLRIAGSWTGAAALAGYALAFSIAYIMLGAGTGALILFASVQIGVIGAAIVKGDRPGILEWVGLAVAFAGLVYLVSPGLVAPHPLGALLMLAAGLCWAAYTLIGRGSQFPLADTTGNFIRTLPVALPLVLLGTLWNGMDVSAALYAVVSGVVASGLGYAVWYAVLPSLTRTRAAIVQLAVPAIAAAGGIIFIAEPVTLRLLVASLAILGGVAIALLTASRRRVG